MKTMRTLAMMVAALALAGCACTTVTRRDAETGEVRRERDCLNPLEMAAGAAMLFWWQ